MGWLFSTGWTNKRDIVGHLTREQPGFTVLRHCCVGNNLWTVFERKREDGTEVRFVALFLLQNGGKDHGWGYKDISEDMGPTEKSCPISYIEMVEAHEKEHGYDPCGYAKEWRAEVRSVAVRKARKLKVGDRIQLYGRNYTVTADLGKRGYMLDNHWRMKTSQVKDVEILTEQPVGAT